MLSLLDSETLSVCVFFSVCMLMFLTPCLIHCSWVTELGTKTLFVCQCAFMQNFNAVQSAFLCKDEKTALYRRLVADYEKDIKLRNIDIQRYLSDVDG